MKNNPAVVLLSGGLDSATTLYIAKKEGFLCHCLIFDYGQRHRKEILAAKIIAKKSGCPYELIKIRLPSAGCSLLNRKLKISVVATKSRERIPLTYVPGRNIVFLSFALSYAEAIKANAIFIGAHTHDYSGYPDCRPEFLRAFNKVMRCGTKAGVENRGIAIKAPLLKMDKAEIIRLGEKLGVPFELTWSCYKGGKIPCGDCDSCYFRAKGFARAKMKDPLVKSS